MALQRKSDLRVKGEQWEGIRCKIPEAGSHITIEKVLNKKSKMQHLCEAGSWACSLRYDNETLHKECNMHACPVHEKWKIIINGQLICVTWKDFMEGI